MTSLMLATILCYGMIGAFDDFFEIGPLSKSLLPLLAGIPLGLLIARDTGLTASVNLAAILSQTGLQPFLPTWLAVAIVTPLLLTLTANLANMHSGFNGLQTGLTGIIILFLIVKLTILGLSSLLFVPVAFLGGWVALSLFNAYPSKIFEGNAGSFMGGAAIGCFMMLGGLYIFGAIMLVPHFLDLLLFLSGKIKGVRTQKFGGLNSDGTVRAPNPFKLKFLLPYYVKLKEWQVVALLYLLTGAFGALGLLVPL